MKSLGIVVMLALMVASATAQGVQVNPTAQRCPAISPDQVRIFTSQSELDNLKAPWHSVASITSPPGPTLFVAGVSVAGPETDIASLKERTASIGANGVLMAQTRSGAPNDIAVQYGECTAPKDNQTRAPRKFEVFLF